MDDSVWQAVVSAAPHLADYLRLGTLLMPGGGGSEITSEAFHAFLSLLSLYSDSVLATRGGRIGSHRVALRGGVAATHWVEGTLEGCRRLELLVEMLAERLVGRRKKIPLLLYLEIIKALCKLHMCKSGLEVNQKSKTLGLTKAAAFKIKWDRHSAKKIRWWMASSTLHSLRPVLYLLALMAYGRRSWKPWIFSLAIDLLADYLGRRQQPRRRRLDATGGRDTKQDWGSKCAEAKSPAPSSAQTSGARLVTEGRQTGEGEPKAKHNSDVFAVEGPAEAGVRDTVKGRIPKARQSAGMAGGGEIAVEGEAGAAEAESSPARREEILARDYMKVEGGEVEFFQGDQDKNEEEEDAMEDWKAEEIRRRRAQLLLYLLRSPAFGTVLEPMVMVLKRMVERVPLLGSMAGVVLDMMMSLHRYHFYHSGS